MTFRAVGAKPDSCGLPLKPYQTPGWGKAFKERPQELGLSGLIPQGVGKDQD